MKRPRKLYTFRLKALSWRMVRWGRADAKRGIRDPYGQAWLLVKRILGDRPRFDSTAYACDRIIAQDLNLESRIADIDTKLATIAQQLSLYVWSWAVLGMLVFFAIAEGVSASAAFTILGVHLWEAPVYGALHVAFLTYVTRALREKPRNRWVLAVAAVTFVIAAGSLAGVRIESVRYGLDGLSPLFVASLTAAFLCVSAGAALLVELLWAKYRAQIPLLRQQRMALREKKHLEKLHRNAVRDCFQFGGSQQLWDRFAEHLVASYLSSFNRRCKPESQVFGTSGDETSPNESTVLQEVIDEVA